MSVRTRANDYRVQVNEDGRWRDHHAGTRPGPAIREYNELGTEPKRLLRNGRPVNMTDEPTLWEDA